MRAVQLTSFGDPVDVLQYVDIPEPDAPGPNQVLIGVEFSPINPNDLMVAQGIYAFRPPLPAVIGNEGVGRVLAVGPGVESVKVGDRILAPPASFTWRERIVVSAGGLSALPADADCASSCAGGDDDRLRLGAHTSGPDLPALVHQRRCRACATRRKDPSGRSRIINLTSVSAMPSKTPSLREPRPLRNRAEFLEGRDAIKAFLTRKWQRELDYRLIKEVWAFRENRIAVRFAYEWHDDSGNWFRSYGNENWEFDEHGLMRLRIASINDLPIKESGRKYHWPLGRRPDGHPSLGDLGL